MSDADRVVDLQLDVAAAFMDARARRCGASALLDGWYRSGYCDAPGRCSSCGEQIHPGRLQAQPSARRCTSCQDKHDRQEATRCRR
jgi:DnaK suppressor protein